MIILDDFSENIEKVEEKNIQDIATTLIGSYFAF